MKYITKLLLSGGISALLLGGYLIARSEYVILYQPTDSIASYAVLIVFCIDLLALMLGGCSMKRLLSIVMKGKKLSELATGLLVSGVSFAMVLWTMGYVSQRVDWRLYYAIPYVLSSLGDFWLVQIVGVTLTFYLVFLVFLNPRLQFTVRSTWNTLKSRELWKNSLQAVGVYVLSLLVFWLLIFIGRVVGIDLDSYMLLLVLPLFPYLVTMSKQTFEELLQQKSVIESQIVSFLAATSYVLLHLGVGTLYNKAFFGSWLAPYQDYLSGKFFMAFVSSLVIIVLYFAFIRASHTLFLFWKSRE